GSIYTFTDTTGYHSSVSGSVSTIVSLGSGSNTAFRGIAFAPNDDPVISLPGGDLSYTENDPATVLDSGAIVTDNASPDLDTGTLTVSFTANGSTDDRLEINNEGTGSGQIGVSGSDVSYGGTTIGSFTGGSGTTDLVVTFNSSATAEAVQALLRNITYRN